jgi:hypothetical protein
MCKSLLSALLLLLLSSLVASAVYQPHEAERIIRSNLREYYENVLDEVLSSRGSDVLISMGRMRPDRRGGIFETLQKEAGAFGVSDVHSSCLVQLPEMISTHITELHGHLLESVQPNLDELVPMLLPTANLRNNDDFNEEDESLPAHDELISTVYSLNQAMGHRLGEQIDSYDIFVRVAKDINSCNVKFPKATKSTSMFSSFMTWLFPENSGSSSGIVQKRDSVESSTTKRFLNSHLDIVRQDMWAEFDARVNDLISSISEDIMDDE